MPVPPDSATELALPVVRTEESAACPFAVRVNPFRSWFFSVVFLVLPAGLSAGEIRWSPDGKWLAFGQDPEPSARQRIRPGWLFRPESFDATPGTREVARESDPGTEPRRLWLVRADLKYRQELDSSEIFLSDPCWTHDGNAVMYAKIVRQPNGSFLWTLREVYGLSRTGTKSRVLNQIELSKDWKLPSPGEKSAVVLRQIHTSARGLILFGDPKNFEPVLYDPASLEIQARFPQGYNARAGGEFVAWLKSGDEWPPVSSELVLTSIADGRSRFLPNMLPDSIPVFSADGRSLYAARHQKPPDQLSVPPGSDWPDIAKIDLQTFKPERYSRPIATPVTPPERLTGLSVTLDSEENVLMCAASIVNRPSEISWFQPKTAATYKRFPPLDVVTHATNLAISADERLALRLGTPDSLLDSSRLPAAVCDPRTEMMSPLVPDDSCVDTWVDFLVRAVIRNRRENPPDPKAAPSRSASSRFFTIMPPIGETSGENPHSNRLKRIGNVGLAALGFDPRNPEMSRLDRLAPAHIEAACLFFALTKRYDAALECLAKLSPKGMDEDRRCRMYAVSAQLNVAAGKVQEGALILEALKAGESRNLGRLSHDGMGGWVVTPSDPTEWQNYLNGLDEETRAAGKQVDPNAAFDSPAGIDSRRPGRENEPFGVAQPP